MNQQRARLNEITDPDKIYPGQTIIPNEKVPDISYKLNRIMQNHAVDPHINNPFYFKEKVRTNGDWDLKNTDEYNSKKYSDGFIFDGKQIRYDAPGNIHYGYVGKATNWAPDEVLLLGAGIEQRRKLSDITKPNYGDDPIDQGYIRYGMDLYKDEKFEKPKTNLYNGEDMSLL